MGREEGEGEHGESQVTERAGERVEGEGDGKEANQGQERGERRNKARAEVDGSLWVREDGL